MPIGINYSRKLYTHPALLSSKYLNKTLTIFDQENSLEKEIIVTYISKDTKQYECICTAYPKKEIDVIEDNKFYLDMQNQILINQYNKLKENVDITNYLIRISNQDSRNFKEYDSINNLVLSSNYSDAIVANDYRNIQTNSFINLESLKIDKESNRQHSDFLEQLIEFEDKLNNIKVYYFYY